MAEPKNTSTPAQDHFGDVGDTYTYTREFPTTIWPHSEAVDFYGPGVDIDAMYANEQWMAQQYGRPMHTIAEKRALRDQSRAKQAAIAQAAEDRMHNAHFDQASRQIGPVGHGIGTGVIRGVADFGNLITGRLLSSKIDEYADAAVSDVERVARRAGVGTDQNAAAVARFATTAPLVRFGPGLIRGVAKWSADRLLGRREQPVVRGWDNNFK